jgi:hypothetical protein
MNFSSRTPDFPIEFNQQNSIPPSPTLPVRSRYRVGRSVESEGCTRKGAPAVHLQSLVNLLASTIRSYSHAFSRCPCRLRTGTTRMLVLSTATVVLHEPGKPGETRTPLERELVFHLNVFNRDFASHGLAPLKPEQPAAVKRAAHG